MFAEFIQSNAAGPGIIIEERQATRTEAGHSLPVDTLRRRNGVAGQDEQIVADDG
jgi:hypothetical protein